MAFRFESRLLCEIAEAARIPRIAYIALLRFVFSFGRLESLLNFRLRAGPLGAAVYLLGEPGDAEY